MSPRHRGAAIGPSPWVARFVPFIAPGGTVLDLACGRGRHTRHLRSLGFRIVAVDIDVAGLADLTGDPQVEIVEADLEGGVWPLPERRFDGIIVTNYLHRPLFPTLLESLVADGVLIYETFAAGNECFGRPRNPDHLLRRGELLAVVAPHATVLAYEDLEITDPSPAAVQRICARKRPAEMETMGD